MDSSKSNVNPSRKEKLKSLNALGKSGGFFTEGSWMSTAGADGSVLTQSLLAIIEYATEPEE